MMSIPAFYIIVGSIFVSRTFLPLDEHDKTLRDKHLISRSSKGGVVILALALSLVGSLFWNIADPSYSFLVVYNFFIGAGWLWCILPTRDPFSKEESYQLPGILYYPGAVKTTLPFLWVLSLFFPLFFIGFYVIAYLACRTRFCAISATEIYLPHAISSVMVSCYIVSLFVAVPPLVLFLVFGIVTTLHYFHSGWQKYRYNWERLNVLENLFAAAKNQNQWDIKWSRPILFLIAKFNMPILIVTVLIETLAVVMLLDYRSAFFAISFLLLMHVGIFVGSGIFFWKWILSLIPLLYVIGNTTLSIDVFVSSPELLFIYGLVVFLSLGFPHLPALAWFDTPLSNRITIEIQHKDTHFILNPYDVRPVDMNFSQSRVGVVFPQDIANVIGCLGAVKPTSGSDYRSIHFVHHLNSLSAAGPSAFTQTTRPPNQSLDECLQERKVTQLGAILREYSDMHRGPSIVDIENQKTTDSELSKTLNNFLDALNSNFVTRKLRWWHFSNFHIWNGKKRDCPEKLIKILTSGERITIKLKREMYFYCSYSKSSYCVYEKTAHLELDLSLKNFETAA